MIRALPSGRAFNGAGPAAGPRAAADDNAITRACTKRRSTTRRATAYGPTIAFASPFPTIMSSKSTIPIAMDGCSAISICTCSAKARTCAARKAGCASADDRIDHGRAFCRLGAQRGSVSASSAISTGGTGASIRCACWRRPASGNCSCRICQTARSTSSRFARAGGPLLEKTDPFGVAFEMPPQSAAVVRDISGYQWRDAPWVEGRGAPAAPGSTSR